MREERDRRTRDGALVGGPGSRWGRGADGDGEAEVGRGLLGCAPRGPVSTAGLQPLRPWLGDSLSDQRGASRLVTEVWDRKDLQPCDSTYDGDLSLPLVPHGKPNDKRMTPKMQLQT